MTTVEPPLTKKHLIVTGASQNHFKSLKQLLSTISFDLFDCIVYDLGLTEDAHTELSAIYPTCILRRFDYSKYPTYYNIQVNAGEYAWKPAILNEVMQTIKELSYPTEILLWCDSGNKIIDRSLTHLKSFVYANKVYSPSSSGDVKRWTHPSTLEWFGISSSSSFLQRGNRNGAILAFHIQDADACALIAEFACCASIKDCIAPMGSSRENHRQDQAVFTILYYKLMGAHAHLSVCDSYLGITIHNDCD
jgi:hypothetical protein